MFLGCCHHGNGSYCRICVQRKATTWSCKSRPGITNMPGTWDHLAPSPWAGQRNEMWVSRHGSEESGRAISGVSCPYWARSSGFGTCSVFVSQVQGLGWVKRLRERPVGGSMGVRK